MIDINSVAKTNRNQKTLNDWNDSNMIDINSV